TFNETSRYSQTAFLVGLTNYKGVLGSNFNYGDYANATPAFVNSGDGFWGANGIFSLDRWKAPLTLVTITDGTSNTFLVGEDIWTADCANGSEPCHGFAGAPSVEATPTCAMPHNTLKHTNGTQIDTTSNSTSEWGTYHGFQSKHTGGVQFVYAGGYVHF